MPIPKGSAVKQVVPVITGTVTAVTYNDDDGVFEYRVDYTDAEGNPSQRWFKESEIEVV